MSDDVVTEVFEELNGLPDDLREPLEKEIFGGVSRERCLARVRKNRTRVIRERRMLQGLVFGAFLIAILGGMVTLLAVDRVNLVKQLDSERDSKAILAEQLHAKERIVQILTEDKAKVDQKLKELETAVANFQIKIEKGFENVKDKR